VTVEVLSLTSRRDREEEFGRENPRNVLNDSIVLCSVGPAEKTRVVGQTTQSSKFHTVWPSDPVLISFSFDPNHLALEQEFDV
jgi:hypothetical protein